MKVLIFDPSQTFAKLLAQGLEQLGFISFICHTTLQALECFDKQTIDAITLSHHLDDGDFEMFLEKLKQQKKM